MDEVYSPSKLEGVPNMVETMALIDDTVGVAPTERLGLLVFGGGVTPTVDGVRLPIVSGLRLSAIKDTMESMVEEVDPSISRSGVAGPNVGLSDQNMRKEGVIPFVSLEKVVQEVDI